MTQPFISAWSLVYSCACSHSSCLLLRLAPTTFSSYVVRLPPARKEVYHIIIVMSQLYGSHFCKINANSCILLHENWHCLPSEGYGKAGNGKEMETALLTEMEMETEDAPIPGAVFFFFHRLTSRVLAFYLAIWPALWVVLWLYFCTVLCD